MGAVLCVLATTRFCLVWADAQSLPARAPPYSDFYLAKKQSVLYHTKEESPFGCSRAVSRWVFDAWTSVVNTALRHDAGELILGDTCPFSATHRLNAPSLYSVQETWKKYRFRDHVFVCLKCFKTFKNEYYLDRHLDRRHTFEAFLLPDDYRGGAPTVGINVSLKGRSIPATFPLSPMDVARRGPCLEEYCAIFDVCERPHNVRYPVLVNNHSITYVSAKPTEEHRTKSLTRSIHCSETRMRQVAGDCRHLIHDCFPLSASSTFIQRLNVYMRHNLCAALESCEVYLRRRSHAGTPEQYTEVAFLETFSRAQQTWSLGRILGIVLFTMGSFLFTVLTVCCWIEQLDRRQLSCASISDIAASDDFSAFSAAIPIRRKKAARVLAE